MHQLFNPQPTLQTTPIEKILLPLDSRDEMPPILAGLQWIWTHPTLKTAILGLLQTRILAGKKPTGRIGMDLWQILVLGVVRLGLDADWDRMQYLANYDLLLRQMLGICPDPWGTNAQRFGHQTLRDNAALVDAALLQEINALVAAEGRQVFQSKPSDQPAPLQIARVILPKRGRKSEAEAEAERARPFVALRKAHSAVESVINALEHHGLNRCLDLRLEGYTRYIGYGVLAYNLHIIGRQLLDRRRAAARVTLAMAA